MAVTSKIYSLYISTQKHTDPTKEQLTVLCYGMTKENRRFRNMMHNQDTLIFFS
jgi:hypothetical protein